MEKFVAIDIDNTLNDFDETLKTIELAYKPVYDTITNDDTKNSSNELRSLNELLHEKCYEQSKAKHGAVEFMHWLRDQGYTIVIMTYRDLRHYSAVTRQWLSDNNIPYDYLFRATNKPVSCRQWGIPILIDDDHYNILSVVNTGTQLYYPILPHTEKFIADALADGATHIVNDLAKGFNTFDEVKAWIQK